MLEPLGFAKHALRGSELTCPPKPLGAAKPERFAAVATIFALFYLLY